MEGTRQQNASAVHLDGFPACLGKCGTTDLGNHTQHTTLRTAGIRKLKGEMGLRGCTLWTIFAPPELVEVDELDSQELREKPDTGVVGEIDSTEDRDKRFLVSSTLTGSRFSGFCRAF
jgi:hypothetical protein